MATGLKKPGENVEFYGWSLNYDGKTDEYINVFLVDDSGSMQSRSSNGKRIMDYAREKAEDIFDSFLHDDLATRTLWFKFHYELNFFKRMADIAGACWKLKSRGHNDDPYTLHRIWDTGQCEEKWWTCEGGATALWASGIMD